MAPSPNPRKPLWSRLCLRACQRGGRRSAIPRGPGTGHVGWPCLPRRLCRGTRGDVQQVVATQRHGCGQPGVSGFGARTARPQLRRAKEASPPLRAFFSRERPWSEAQRPQSHQLRPQRLFACSFGKSLSKYVSLGKKSCSFPACQCCQHPPPHPSREKLLHCPLTQGTSARASLRPGRLSTEASELTRALFLVKQSVFHHKGT